MNNYSGWWRFGSGRVSPSYSETYFSRSASESDSDEYSSDRGYHSDGFSISSEQTDYSGEYTETSGGNIVPKTAWWERGPSSSSDSVNLYRSNHGVFSSSSEPTESSWDDTETSDDNYFTPVARDPWGSQDSLSPYRSYRDGLSSSIEPTESGWDDTETGGGYYAMHVARDSWSSQDSSSPGRSDTETASTCNSETGSEDFDLVQQVPAVAQRCLAQLHDNSMSEADIAYWLNQVNADDVVKIVKDSTPFSRQVALVKQFLCCAILVHDVSAHHFKDNRAAARAYSGILHYRPVDGKVLAIFSHLINSLEETLESARGIAMLRLQDCAIEILNRPRNNQQGSYLALAEFKRVFLQLVSDGAFKLALAGLSGKKIGGDAPGEAISKIIFNKKRAVSYGDDYLASLPDGAFKSAQRADFELFRQRMASSEHAAARPQWTS